MLAQTLLLRYPRKQMTQISCEGHKEMLTPLDKTAHIWLLKSVYDCGRQHLGVEFQTLTMYANGSVVKKVFQFITRCLNY